MAQTRPTLSADPGQSYVTADDGGRRLRNLDPIPPEALEEIQDMLGIERSGAPHRTDLLTRLAVEHIIDLHLIRAHLLITSEPKRLVMARKTISDANNLAHRIPDACLQAKCLFWESVVDAQEDKHENAALGFYYAFVNFAPFLATQTSLDINALPTSEGLCIEMCLITRYLKKYREYIVQFIDSEVVRDRERAREMLGFIDRSIQRSSHRSTDQVDDRTMTQSDGGPTYRLDNPATSQTVHRLRDQNRTRPLSEVSDQFERLMHEVQCPVELLQEHQLPTTSTDADQTSLGIIHVPDESSQEFQPMDDIMPMLQAGIPRTRTPRDPIRVSNMPEAGSNEKNSDRTKQTAGQRLRPTSASTQGSTQSVSRSNSTTAIDRQRPSLSPSQNVGQDGRASIKTAPLITDAFWPTSPKSQPLGQEVAKEIELSDALTPEKLDARVHNLSGRRASVPVDITVKTDSSSSVADIGHNLPYPRDSTRPTISSPLRTVFSASEDVPEDVWITDALLEQPPTSNAHDDVELGKSDN